MYPGSVLLHHYGVLCPGPALRGAASRQEDSSVPAHGLGHGHRWRNELSSSPQDHPQRPQVTEVSFWRRKEKTIDDYLSAFNDFYLFKNQYMTLKFPSCLPSGFTNMLLKRVVPLTWCRFSYQAVFAPNITWHFMLHSSMLITYDDLVKISDFGTSKELSDKSTKMSFAGTVAWMAPEVIRNEPVSEKVDIW